MKKFFRIATLLCLYSFQTAFSFTISFEDANKIGEKIWKNECGGSKEGLTNWKKGENFASLGIGHFIWYSHDKKERFKETFPALLTFLTQQGVSLPPWLKDVNDCPWNSREEFYKDIESPKMKILRQFLFDTKALQAVFIANRLEQSFTAIVDKSLEREKTKIYSLFTRLSKDPNGLYALVDYVNFNPNSASHYVIFCL